MKILYEAPNLKSAMDCYITREFESKGLGMWVWVTRDYPEIASEKNVKFTREKDQFLYEMHGGQKWLVSIIDQWVFEIWKGQ